MTDKFEVTRRWLKVTKARAKCADEVTLPTEQMLALLETAERGIDVFDAREELRPSEEIVRHFFSKL